MNIPKDRALNYDIEDVDSILDPIEDKISSEHLHNKMFHPYPNEEEVDIKFLGEEDDVDLDYEEYGDID